MWASCGWRMVDATVALGIGFADWAHARRASTSIAFMRVRLQQSVCSRKFRPVCDSSDGFLKTSKFPRNLKTPTLPRKTREGWGILTFRIAGYLFLLGDEHVCFCQAAFIRHLVAVVKV